jgi:hypothetical protein
MNKTPSNIYNPPLVITDHEYTNNYGKKNIVYVIRDDYLVGGTKQRALVKLMEQSEYENFVGYGASNGYAMVAGAFAAQLTGKKFDYFIFDIIPPTPAMKKAMDKVFKDNITLHRISPHGKMSELESLVNEFAKKNNAYKIEFGMQNDDYLKLLIQNIKIAWINSDDQKRINKEPKRLWLVAGSGTILKALDTIFPNTQFMVVQVGKKIWPDQLHRISKKSPNSILFISNLTFYQNVPIDDRPPYDSLASYDAKLWKFVKQHGQDGDFIWNVAPN